MQNRIALEQGTYNRVVSSGRTKRELHFQGLIQICVLISDVQMNIDHDNRLRIIPGVKKFGSIDLVALLLSADS